MVEVHADHSGNLSRSTAGGIKLAPHTYLDRSDVNSSLAEPAERDQHSQLEKCQTLQLRYRSHLGPQSTNQGFEGFLCDLTSIDKEAFPVSTQVRRKRRTNPQIRCLKKTTKKRDSRALPVSSTHQS